MTRFTENLAFKYKLPKINDELTGNITELEYENDPTKTSRLQKVDTILETLQWALKLTFGLAMLLHRMNRLGAWLS